MAVPAPEASSAGADHMAPAGGGRTATEILAWSRSLIDPALRAAVDGLPASVRHVAGYHFGWWDEAGRPIDAAGGKGIRPALVLLAAQAVGGTAGQAVPAAIAVELAHNFSLLHDDVMDADGLRHHRPTAWRVFGANTAILAGDALQVLALDVLAASGHPAATAGVRMLSGAVQELIEGQSADLSFERRSDVALAECRAMALGKTGALLGCAGAIGASFGGGDPGQLRRLRRFGADVGLAFQHVDDLLGIWGDPAATGKPVYSDLRSRKKSLPVVAALTSDSAAGRELAALYRRDRPLSDAERVHAADLIDIAGGRVWSRAEAARLLARALRQLRRADPAPRPAAALETLARMIVIRNR
jgi:geranylgeranyl diphosphate synthase, type I